MILPEQVDDLKISIIQELGLDVDSRGNLIDQDTHKILLCNNKTIKFSLSTQNVLIGSMDVPFNILEDLKLSEMLFGYYLAKEEEFSNLCVTTYYTEYEPAIINNGEKGQSRTRVVVKLLDGTELYSDYFYPANFKYIDFIIKRSGKPINLHAFEV